MTRVGQAKKHKQKNCSICQQTTDIFRFYDTLHPDDNSQNWGMSIRTKCIRCRTIKLLKKEFSIDCSTDEGFTINSAEISSFISDELQRWRQVVFTYYHGFHAIEEVRVLQDLFASEARTILTGRRATQASQIAPSSTIVQANQPRIEVAKSTSLAPTQRARTVLSLPASVTNGAITQNRTSRSRLRRTPAWLSRPTGVIKSLPDASDRGTPCNPVHIEEDLSVPPRGQAQSMLLITDTKTTATGAATPSLQNPPLTGSPTGTTSPAFEPLTPEAPPSQPSSSMAVPSGLSGATDYPARKCEGIARNDETPLQTEWHPTAPKSMAPGNIGMRLNELKRKSAAFAEFRAKKMRYDEAQTRLSGLRADFDGINTKYNEGEVRLDRIKKELAIQVADQHRLRQLLLENRDAVAQFKAVAMPERDATISDEAVAEMRLQYRQLQEVFELEDAERTREKAERLRKMEDMKNLLG